MSFCPGTSLSQSETSPGLCPLHQAVPLCVQLCWAPCLLKPWFHLWCSLPQQALEQLPGVQGQELE